MGYTEKIFAINVLHWVLRLNFLFRFLETMSSHLKNIVVLCDYFRQQDQTPQADLFQRIIIVIDQIKSKLIELGQDEKIGK